MLHFPASCIAAAGLNDAGIEMPFWPGNGPLDESTSAHINMTLTPRQLTITGMFIFLDTSLNLNKPEQLQV